MEISAAPVAYHAAGVLLLAANVLLHLLHWPEEKKNAHTCSVYAGADRDACARACVLVRYLYPVMLSVPVLALLLFNALEE